MTKRALMDALIQERRALKRDCAGSLYVSGMLRAIERVEKLVRAHRCGKPVVKK